MRNSAMLSTGNSARAGFFFRRFAVLALTAAAFAVRLAYLLHSHPFIDEFTSVLAAQAILQRGLPILPSGLLYEHGMLFTYLAAPFVALAGTPPLFAVARWPGLLIGTLTVPLLYALGRRWFSPGAGLLAAALLAFSPEGMVWGGRARMYALAQLLILLMAWLAYAGSRPHHRAGLLWLAILTLLAALLAQLGALLFVPPLLIGMVVVYWLSGGPGTRPAQRFRLLNLTPLTLGQWLALGGSLGLGLLVKRLGQPLGAAALGSDGAPNIPTALWDTIAYQAGLVLDWGETVEFLAEQFGVAHHLWLAGLALLGLIAFAVLAVRDRRHPARQTAYLFACLLFGLVVVEMITLLKPFRRNPRYLVMGLPLFYLMVVGGLEQIRLLVSNIAAGRQAVILKWASGLALLAILIVQARGTLADGLIAYRTPEPAYEEAFAYVAAQRQPNDAVLTMNTSAAALYLDRTEYFAMQDDADQFLLNSAAGPIDRWLGAPWLGNVVALNQALNDHPQVWFVVDTIRLPEYYRGDWQALLKTQMDLAWAEDNALVYRTRPDRHPLPSAPDTALQVNLDNQISLIGYSRSTAPSSEAADTVELVLFWQAQAPVSHDYTVFVHLRDANGANVVQQDGQPLAGEYPTGQWRVGETIIDPRTIPLPLDLPPGRYQLWTGMYLLETLERLPIVADQSGENAIPLGTLTIPGRATP